MSFKKNVISAALFATALGFSAVANAAPSANVTLQGIITLTTCDVTVNNGVATLDVGVFKSGQFAVNTQLGAVTLPVALTNCTADETGNLIIQGVTATANPAGTLFTALATDTVGFMIKNSVSAQIVEGTGPLVSVSAVAGGLTYNFSVGMGSTTLNPQPGSYTVPITVAYIVD